MRADELPGLEDEIRRWEVVLDDLLHEVLDELLAHVLWLDALLAVVLYRETATEVDIADFGLIVQAIACEFQEPLGSDEIHLRVVNVPAVAVETNQVEPLALDGDVNSLLRVPDRDAVLLPLARVFSEIDHR